MRRSCAGTADEARPQTPVFPGNSLCRLTIKEPEVPLLTSTGPQSRQRLRTSPSAARLRATQPAVHLTEPLKGILAMKRAAAVLVLCLTPWCSDVLAASWAEGMFSELRHDFGSIPRGADVRCNFLINNNTGSPVRISGLHMTCGCTQVSLDDKVVMDSNVKVSRESPGWVTRYFCGATIRCLVC